MDWVYLVILASFCWSIINIMDKFLIDRRIHNPVIITIFIRVTSIIPLLLLVPFVGFSLPTIDFVAWILLAGAFSSTGVIVYYKAMKMDEISRVVPLFQFTPVFVLLLSFLFIGEVLGILDYLGFVIIVIGGLIITSRRLSRLLKVERVFWVAVSAGFLFASSYVIMKYVLSNVEYWSAFILLWSLETVLITSLLGSRRVRKSMKSYLKKLDNKDKMIILIDSIVSISAFIFYYMAISMGPVTLVGAVRNVRLVFIFLFAVLFTRFFPGVMRENTEKMASIQKIMGIILIITGVLVTQLF